MTLYARSDVMGFTIPVESGGCGQVHSRPVTDGAPAKTFELDCPRCSVALRDDPMWSAHANDVPKTPDEQARLDEEAKRGMIASKEDLVSGIAEGLATGLRNLTTCRGCGKMNPAGMRFCGECGTRLGAPENTEKTSEESSVTEQRAGASGGLGETEKALRAENVRTLRKMAKERDLDEAGTKDELVARLLAAE